MNNSTGKTKEEVLAERQAKKAAKQQNRVDPKPAGMAPAKVNEAKQATVLSPAKSSKPTTAKPAVASVNSNSVPKAQDKLPKSPAPTVVTAQAATTATSAKPQEGEKTKEQVLQEREARRLAKLAGRKKEDAPGNVQQSAPATKPSPVVNSNSTDLAVKMEKLHIEDATKAKPSTKAERRAIQEAQRAAKAKALEEKKPVAKKQMEIKTSSQSAVQKRPVAVTQSTKNSAVHKVKLFKHLYSDKCDLNIKVNQSLHPAIVKLGLQFASDAIVGSNARCYAFLNAMKILINDYVTPPEKVFSRGLEAEIQPAIEFLQNCRPLAVSMTNTLKYIKVLISLEVSNESDDDKKQRLIDKIDTYASEQIETAAIAISLKVREKISNGDVILTYGCSSLIKRTLVEAYKDSLRFRVIVVDSRPDHEGQEMLKSLAMLGINCTYVMINAISFIMPEVSKVLLGAHALLANGFVMSRVGTAQIALVANSYNVPVLVCCETHKVSERVQTDAFVFNELGDPNALVINKNTRETFDHLKDWENIPHLTPLNIRYDFTPPELVTAVITEIAILPCTSVQVILRRNQVE